MTKSIFKSSLGVIITLLLLTLATSALAQDDYFIYANFDNANTGGVYQYGNGCGGYAIDKYSGNLYVARRDAGSNSHWCDVYLVSIPVGSDPNTHPDNPENTGTMVARTLTLVGSKKISDDIGTFDPQANEFYVDATHVYFGPSQGGIHQWDKNTNGTLGTYIGKVVNASPPGGVSFQTLAYDTDRNLWYSGNAYPRDIYSIATGGGSWNYEFTHRDYAGSHHDGMEYVGGYLWISDMTSDSVAQWEYSGGTWNEVDVFGYDGGAGMHVEGMGFGPLGHFWCTGWSIAQNLYELGGGGLEVDELPIHTKLGLILLILAVAGFFGYMLVRRRAIISSR